MSEANSTLTHERLKELLEYNSDTGAFTWIKRPVVTARRVSPGDAAGVINATGYVYISIDKEKWRAHRLAWFYVHGVAPLRHIDHINGIRSDNRISNLREATVSANQQNLRIAQKNSRTGKLGVAVNGQGYCARIMVKGKQLYLGQFSTSDDAHEAYLKAKREMHEFCTI